MQPRNRKDVILTPSLGVIPFEYRRKWHMAKNYILWAKFCVAESIRASCHGLITLKRMLWKSASSEGVCHLERQLQVDGDVARNRSMDRWIGEWCSYNFAAGSFHTKKLCSRRLSREVEFYWHKQRYRVFVPPLGDLGVTYTVHLWLVGKHVVDFL